MGLSDADDVNFDVLNILLNNVKKVDAERIKNPECEDIRGLLKFFTERNKKSLGLTENPDTDAINQIVETLDGRVGEIIIRRACRDEAFIPVIVECINKNINPKVLIEVVTNAEEDPEAIIFEQIVPDVKNNQSKIKDNIKNDSINNTEFFNSTATLLTNKKDIINKPENHKLFNNGNTYFQGY